MTASDVLRAELRALARVAPVVFGGLVQDERLRITELFGTRTAGLRGLLVPTRTGLGGRVIHQQRPTLVEDYARSAAITHDYDRPVLGEGISSVFAVPVLVTGRSRAVLYAAVRGQDSLGTRTMSAVVSAAQRIGGELRVREEVERRLRFLTSPSTEPDLQHVRDVDAELRALAATVADPDLRGKLQELSDRLAGSGRATEGPRLSARERDVLAQVALGRTNTQVAEQLGLLPETVKSYLRSASGKLDAHSRLEAVVAARRHGLLP